MTLSTRLRRVEARLSARDHAVVLLQRWKMGNPADIGVLDLPGVPQAHRSECLSMVQRFVYAFELFTNWQGQLQGEIALAEAHLAHLETVLDWEAYAEEQRLKPPPLAEQATALRAGLVESIASCWREIQACNEALETLSAPYGEDAAHPALRDCIGVLANTVIALRNDLADLGTEVELPAPLPMDRQFFNDVLLALP